ncbi:hypothetical protein LTR36_002377 [Oleoguttula mirabilis]|uniref:F-box domain-containing protein n=1 Tax=Oleoguttula mirabilis TaxID=1507867 RepID=A0AAV9JMK7_9PEZI|nr:hypothetical protein LTR36_002377 [Oleoguttula mirabilis]
MAPQTATTSQQPSLLTLPQELQDVIFDYAYPSEVTVKHISREQWEYREKSKHRDDITYGERPFPTPKINDFTISKQYLVAAAKTYVENQNFHEGFDLLFDGTDAVLQTGILLQWLTTMTTRWPDAFLLSMLPNLKNLTMKIDEMAFEAAEPKYVWHHVLEEEDLKKSMVYAEIMRCPSLQVFKAVASDGRYAKGEQQKRIWKSNVQAFEALVIRDLKKSKAKMTRRGRECHSAWPPLYPRPRVCFDTSNLLGPATAQDIGRLMRNTGGANEDYISLVDRMPNADELNDDGDSTTSSEDAADHRWIAPKWSLKDRDIPETANGLRVLLRTDPDAVVEWVRYAKDMTCGKPLEGRAYCTDRVRPSSEAGLRTQSAVEASQSMKASTRGTTTAIDTREQQPPTLHAIIAAAWAWRGTDPAATHSGGRHAKAALTKLRGTTARSEQAKPPANVGSRRSEAASGLSAPPVDWAADVLYHGLVLVFLVMLWYAVTGSHER